MRLPAAEAQLQHTGHTVPPAARIVVAAAALVGTLVQLAAPAGAQAAARDLDEGCPPGEVAERRFADQDSFFPGLVTAISCIVHFGIADGYPDGTYRADRQVSRAQMAQFVARTLMAGGLDRDPAAPDAFADDDPHTLGSSPGAHWDINWLASLRVVAGHGDNTYRPGNHMTRSQLATVVNHAVVARTGNPIPAAEGDRFPDEHCGVHDQSVNVLAGAGIVSGKDDGRYHCGEDISRGQMALILARTLDFLAEERGVAMQAPLVRVMLGNDLVEQGRDVDGNAVAWATAAQVTAVSVDGCGLDVPVTDEDLQADGVQFLLTIPASTAPGVCRLAFTIRLDDGSETVRSVVVLVAPTGEEAALALERDTAVRGQFVTGSLKTTSLPAEILWVRGCATSDLYGSSDRPWVEQIDVAGRSSRFIVSLPRVRTPGRCALTFLVAESSVIRWTPTGPAPLRDFALRTRTVTITPAETFLDGPELVDVELFPQIETRPILHSIHVLRYLFDEEIQASLEPGAFCAGLWDGAQVCADPRRIERDPRDPRAVLARFNFPADDDQLVAEGTLAAVSHAAVHDREGLANPEASLGLKPVGTGHVTAGPDLLHAGARLPPEEPAHVRFEFDEAAHVVDPARYRLVMDDGSVHAAAAVEVNAEDAHSHTARFTDVTFDQVVFDRSARAVVAAGAVSDRRQDPDRVGIEGHANPIQAVATAGGLDEGLTAAPDLVSAGFDLDAGIIVYRFDQDIAALASPQVFSAFTAEGRVAAATEAERPNARTVLARFPMGILATATGVSIEDRAVTGADGRPARLDSAALLRVLPPAWTAAPDLVSVRRSVTPSGVRLTFTFDAPMVFPAGAPGFAVYGAGGTRTSVTGCAPGAQSTEVVCSADATTPLATAMQEAVLAAASPGAVVGERADPNLPASLPIRTG